VAPRISARTWWSAVVSPYIDMNAFAGTREELESMTLRLPGH
jgi:hypothetical protein